MIRITSLSVVFSFAAILGTATPALADPVTITSGFVGIGGTPEVFFRGFRRSVGYDITTDEFRLHGDESDGPTQQILSPLLPRVGYWTAAGSSEEIFVFLDQSLLTVTSIPSTSPTPFFLTGRLAVINAETSETLFDDIVSGSGTATWLFSPNVDGTPIVWSVRYEFSDTAPVPEPASVLLVAAGIAGLAARRRRDARRDRSITSSAAR
jgi:hypothetical protein